MLYPNEKTPGERCEALGGGPVQIIIRRNPV